MDGERQLHFGLCKNSLIGMPFGNHCFNTYLFQSLIIVWLYLKASYCSFSAIVFDLFSFSYNFCSRERLCCYKTKMFQCWTKSDSSMDMWMIWMKVVPLIVNILVDPYIQTNDKIQLHLEVLLGSINLSQTLRSLRICLIMYL